MISNPGSKALSHPGSDSDPVRMPGASPLWVLIFTSMGSELFALLPHLPIKVICGTKNHMTLPPWQYREICVCGGVSFTQRKQWVMDAISVK